MRKLNQDGQVSPLLISTVALAVLLVSALVYAVMTYGKYTDARDNVNGKIAEAVDLAKEKQRTELNEEFAEKEKNPFELYESPASLGSLKVTYPKTWSAYVEEVEGSVQINAYFHPKFVPSPIKKIKYALRLQLKNGKYAEQVRTYNEKVDRGDFKATPIEIAGTAGTRYEGKIDQDTNGIVVALPIRDKTIMLWTESTDYSADFNDIIVKNFTFSP